MNRFETIETRRLVIRPLRMEDWPEVYSRASDPEVVRFTGELLTLDETKRLLQKRIDEQFAKAPLGGRAVVLKENGLNIGYCGLDYLPHSTEQQIELFYGLTRKFWGRGFASEAAAAILNHGFCDLNLHEIVAAVHPDNSRSIKVAENVGLIYRKKIH